jgi:RNA polymerase sigma factor (sigma-70 family)
MPVPPDGVASNAIHAHRCGGSIGIGIAEPSPPVVIFGTMNDPYTTLVQLSTGHIVLSRSLSLAELVEGAREGYAPYIGELRARFGDELEAAIEPLVGDAAAEVVDDLFMSLPRVLPGYEETGRFRAWLFGAVYNRARTLARTERRRIDTGTMPVGVDIATPATAESDIDEQVLLERALAVLSDAEREAWLLSYEGYSPAAIATQLGIDANAAAVRVHRARKRLVSELSRLFDV